MELYEGVEIMEMSSECHLKLIFSFLEISVVVIRVVIRQ
jgi:hypothetical protein